MKKVLFVCFIFLILAGCEQEAKITYDEALNGTWVCFYYDGIGILTSNDSFYNEIIFDNENWENIYKENGEITNFIKGTYTIDNDILFLDFINYLGNAYLIPVRYSIDDDILYTSWHPHNDFNPDGYGYLDPNDIDRQINKYRKKE